MAAGKPVGVMYAEFTLDYTPFTKAQKQLLKDATTSTSSIEGEFKKLGIRSSAEFDLMRQKISNSYSAIANNAKSTANDILRAEQAKNRELERLNEMQFGKQTSYLTQLKAHWLAYSAAAYGAMKVIQTGWEMMDQAAKFDQQKVSFDRLAASYGTNGSQILAELKKVSGGTINSMLLVEKAGTAMMMGITPEKVTQLMEIARATARMTGQDVEKAFSDISLAVGRQSRMILDNLGIIVSVEKANQDYARSLGKTADGLTDTEKKMAFMNATITAGRDLMERMGEQTDTDRDKMERFKASVDNLSTSIGRLALAFTPLIEASTSAIDNMNEALEKGRGPAYNLAGMHAGGFDLEETEGGSNYLRLPITGEPLFPPRPPGTTAAAKDTFDEKAEEKTLDAELKRMERLQTAQDRADAEQEKADQKAMEESIANMKFLQDAQNKADEEVSKEGAKQRDELNKIREDLLKTDPIDKYRDYSLGALQSMVRDFQTTEEEKRRITQAINEKIRQDNIGTAEAFSAGWSEAVFGMRGEFQSTAQYIMDFGDEMARGLHSSISDTFYDGFKGKLDSAQDIFRSFTEGVKNSFFRMVSDIAAKKIIMMFTSAWDESKGSVSGQGTIESMLGIDVPILTFAGGGRVPGSGQGDTVPAMLTPGEYVLSRDMLQHPFVSSLVGLLDQNSNGGSTRGGVQHFAGGGRVLDIMGHDAFEAEYARYRMWLRDPRTLMAVMQTEALGGDLMADGPKFVWNFPLSPQTIPWSERPWEKQDFNWLWPDDFQSKKRGGFAGIVEKWMPPVTMAVISAIAGGALGAGTFGTGTTWSSYGAMANASYVPATASAYSGAAAGAGAVGGAAAESSVWSQLYDAAASYVSNLGTSIWDTMLNAWEMIKDPTSIFKNFDLWDTISNIPSKIFDRIINWDFPGYLQDNASTMLRGLKLGLSGMSGGELLDASAMAQALGVGQVGVASYATGTGPAGLPRTGLYFGHQGEIVKSKADSDRERGGSDRPIELHVHVLDKEFVTTIRKESEHVIVNRNGRGMSASTQKVYS